MVSSVITVATALPDPMSCPALPAVTLSSADVSRLWWQLALLCCLLLGLGWSGNLPFVEQMMVLYRHRSKKKNPLSLLPAVVERPKRSRCLMLHVCLQHVHCCHVLFPWLSVHVIFRKKFYLSLLCLIYATCKKGSAGLDKEFPDSLLWFIYATTWLAFVCDKMSSCQDKCVLTRYWAGNQRFTCMYAPVNLKCLFTVENLHRLVYNF